MAAESNAAMEYQVSVSGDGITINKSVSADVARGIVALIMGGSGVGMAPAAGSGTSSGQADQQPHIQGGPQRKARVSLREHLDSHSAKRNPDKITAIGHFLREYEGQDDFTRDDVKARFRAAGEPAPANFPRDFAVALRTGWIAEDSAEPGKFYVTQKGETALEAGFTGDVGKAVNRSSRRRGKKRDGTGKDDAE